MIGVRFKILARTPVPKLSTPELPPPPPPERLSQIEVLNISDTCPLSKPA